MNKVIAAINLTIDGYCDHTAGIPDQEIHHHYSELLKNAAVILYGRKTYQLMQYWQTILKNPSEDKSMFEFAQAIDKIEKIVFSNTLKDLQWESARFANYDLKHEVDELKKLANGDILVGSPGLINALTHLELIDEYQLCIHPVVLGNGLALFKNNSEKLTLKLVGTKTFPNGAVILYYHPTLAEG